ncbi:MAG: radical SAM protein [Candidatus Eisenbacteria bacterium]|nr:radical SAM protein [Candidatus Eisenbacteria bacterium]
MARRPGFQKLFSTGILERRARAAEASLSACRLCPRTCGADRASDEAGACGATGELRIYRHMPHHGEEPPISGTRGSGTVFFSNCTMSCVYCQNERMSRRGEGSARSAEELARMLEELADAGCHNWNFVSPTQYLPWILRALVELAGRDVALPVVWNTSGYECSSTLELLEGIVDVYLSDIRYGVPGPDARLSGVSDYVPVSREALIEMREQVGPLVLDDEGTALRGLVVRHLVIPNGLSGTREALRFVAERLGRDTAVSLMSQYYPVGEAVGDEEVGRRITRGEWRDAVDTLESLGLDNGWVQEFHGELYPAAGSRIEPD